jgi:putative adhesin
MFGDTFLQPGIRNRRAFAALRPLCTLVAVAATIYLRKRQSVGTSFNRLAFPFSLHVQFDEQQPRQEAIKMRLKSIITLIAVFTLSAGGCHRGSDQAQANVDTRSANVAPSDFKPDAKSNTKDGAIDGAKSEGETASVDSNKAETNSIVDKGGEGVDFAEREEIRRSYTLKPGADVVVSGVNGRVDVETAETDHAEVLIVRSAKKREDLQFRKIRIEHDSSELRIGLEGDRRSVFSAFGSIPEGRQRVMLKLPRKVAFNTNGVNGDVAVGEIEGGVDVRGVNGKVNIEQATGGASFRGVNGKIDATVAKLSMGGGIDLNGVNGNTTIRFVGEVNADVEARGHNGRVESDLPNLEESKDEKRHGRYSARIGTGGPRISIRGVNGNVSLTKAEKSVAGVTKAASK